MNPVNNPTQKNEFACIDLVKLLCAFLVVAIHTEPFAGHFWLDKGLGVLTRLPVPFFFTASGYFLFAKAEKNISFAQLKKYVGRIGLLYGIWSVIYLPFLVQQCLSLEKGFLWGLFFYRILWQGTCGHLWFLIGTMVGAVLTWGCYHWISRKTTLTVAALLLVFATLVSTYLLVLEKIGIDLEWLLRILDDTIGTRNGIFYGFFYVALGSFLAKMPLSEKIRRYSACLLMAIAALGAEGLLVLKCFGAYESILWFSTPFAVAMLFLLALNMKPYISREKAVKIRNTSTIIYTSQFIFINFLTKLGIAKHGFLIFVLTLTTTLLFSFLLIRLCARWRWVKYLY